MIFFSITNQGYRNFKRPNEFMLTMTIHRKLLGALPSSDFTVFDL